MKNYFKSLSAEQPEERFFSLKLTKLVLWSFGFAFVITFTISLFDAVTLEFKPTSEGVNYLVFELFKAPVAVAGFALPILGLIGLNHRSEQTKKQIEEARVQNDFANYYKHKEEFLKYVNAINQDKRYNVNQMIGFHSTLYPKSRTRNFNVDVEQIKRIDHHINSFVKFIPLLFEEDSHRDALGNLNGVKVSLQKLFNLNDRSAKNIYAENLHENAWHDNTSAELHRYIWQFASLVRSIDDLLKFDPQYKCSERMDILFRTDWPPVKVIKFDEDEKPIVQIYKKLCESIERV